MGYSFFRLEKIKSASHLSSAFRHNFRKMDVPNADPEKLHLNEELVSLNGMNYVEKFNSVIQSLDYYKDNKIRKNAVLAYEVVTSFSRDDIGVINLEEWKKDNVEWLRSVFNADMNAYGDNVVSVVTHEDEAANIHCHAIIIPIDGRGQLCASSFTDGKMKMIGLQDSYGKMMEQRHCLKRGIPKNFARLNHKEIRHLYAEIGEEFFKNNVLPPPKEKETTEEYAERVSDFVKDLKGVHLVENRKNEQKILEMEINTEQRAKQAQLNIVKENQDLKKENRAIKKETKELIREFGSIPIIREKLQALEDQQRGIEEIPESPDKELFLRQLEFAIQRGEAEREKEKEEERKKLEKQEYKIRKLQKK